jgi:hypothetical protein
MRPYVVYSSTGGEETRSSVGSDSTAEANNMYVRILIILH